MPFSEVNYSSATNEWATPQGFFDRLHAEFDFTLDAAANADNAKCPAYFTQEQDSLKQEWEGRVFVNPPYGKDVAAFVKKAATSFDNPACELVVVLIFARTDTQWWHLWAMRAEEIRFVRGRLKFGGCANSAPSPSALLIFRPGMPLGNPRVSTYHAHLINEAKELQGKLL